MKGFIILIIMYSIVILLSIAIRRLTIGFRSKWAYLLLPIYIIVITIYIDFMNWLTNYLRGKQVYLDMGHANIGIVLLGFVSYITAVIFIVNIAFVRHRKWKYD